MLDGGGLSPGGGDFEDMYFIVVTDAVAFSASTSTGDGTTDFDSQLVLLSAIVCKKARIM